MKNGGNGKNRATFAPKVTVAAQNPGLVILSDPTVRKEVQRLQDPKRTYLLVSVGPGAPLILSKYDVYLCPWANSTQLFEDYTDGLEVGEKASLSFQVLELTDAEAEEWLRKNGGR